MGVLFALRNRNNTKPQPPAPTVLAYDPRRLGRFIPYDPMGILKLRDSIRINPGVRVVNPIQSATGLGHVGFNPNNYYQRQADGSRLHVVDGKIAEIVIGAEKPDGGRVLRVSSGSSPNSGCPPKTKHYDGGPFLPLDEKSPCNTAPTNSIKIDSDFCSPFAPAEGDPRCLYDGKIDALGIKLASPDFDSEGGGNGWFNGHASFDLLADVQQQGNHVVLINTGLANVAVDILGSRVNLVEATNDTKVDNQSGQNSPQTDIKATALPGTLNADFQTGFHQIIPGPGARFFIGPVPISITSKLEATLSLDKTQPSFQKFPDSCASSQTGAMTMSMELNAAATVELRAAIDAVVASAGIEGKLALVDDILTGITITEVAPSINKITFKPKVSYRLQRLVGHIYLFVEIDLLIYSKTWRVEVFNFTGFDSSGEVSPTPGVISSKKK